MVAQVNQNKQATVVGDVAIYKHKERIEKLFRKFRVKFEQLKVWR